MSAKDRLLSSPILHCRDGQLYVAGVYNSPLGPIPVRASVAVEGEVSDGVIQADEIPPSVESAVKECEGEIMAQIEGDSMELGAEDVVQRARAGDQVAMGLLQTTGQQAAKGNRRAQRAQKVISKYIENHPHKPFIAGAERKMPRRQALAHRKLHEAIIGDDLGAVIVCLPLAGWCGVVSLANGLELNRPAVEAMAAMLPDAQHQAAFTEGYRSPNAAALQSALKEVAPALKKSATIGFEVGQARKIQKVRMPNSNIAEFDPDTGWELGF